MNMINLSRVDLNLLVVLEAIVDEGGVSRAAEKLKVEWSKVEPPFPAQAALYDHIRKAPVRKRAEEGKPTGNVEEAFKSQLLNI